MQKVRFGRAWKDLKKELFRNANLRKAYEELEPEFQVARAMIALRAAKDLTHGRPAGRR